MLWLCLALNVGYLHTLQLTWTVATAPSSPMGLPRGKGAGLVLCKILLWFWITDTHLQAIKTSHLLFYIPIPICVIWKVLIVHHRAQRLATVARWRRSRSAPGRVASVRGFRGERGQASSLLRLQAALVRERERRDLDRCFWAPLGAHETAANHRHPCCFDAPSKGVSWWVYGSARPDLSAHAQYVEGAIQKLFCIMLVKFTPIKILGFL